MEADHTEIDVDKADAMADELIFFDGVVIATSGGFSHHTEKSWRSATWAEVAKVPRGMRSRSSAISAPRAGWCQPIFDPEGAHAGVVPLCKVGARRRIMPLAPHLSPASASST